MSERKKLFRVVCRGMTDTHGTSFVVANNSSDAYERVLRDLERRGLGFDTERELDRVELLAEDMDYPHCGRKLYLP